MYGKVKLTKRQIKEDKFTTFMLNAKHQFLENWQYFVIGIAAVILIIVAIVYYFNSRAAARLEAAEQLSSAIMDYRSGTPDVALLSLNEITIDYPGTEMADQATFLLAKIHFEQRNFTEAMRYYQKYVNEFKENKLRRASALGGIAACYENQGSFGEAGRQYAAALEAYPDGPFEGDFSMGAMRSFLLAGDSETARRHLENIKEKFPGTDLERKAIRLFHEKSSS